MDKCYKLHSYPPGFKQQPRNQFNNQPVAINQVSSQSNHTEKNNQEVGGAHTFLKILDKTQYHQVITMFANNLSSFVNTGEHQDGPSASYSIGTCLCVSVTPLISSSRFWVVDSRASRHIYPNANAFISMRPIKNFVVTLPNHTHIAVQFCGDVRLSSKIILRDVLFLLEFKFNRMSMSSVITRAHLTVSFFYDHFVIQEISTEDDWQG